MRLQLTLLISIAATFILNAQKAPNILIITVDNVGYGDFRCYNPSSPIITPNLDQLAKEGARLTSFYTAGATCTVSRACLLTGRLPQRTQLDTQLSGIAGNYGIGLRHSEVLLPALLKKGSHPYATGAFGKWNIGFAPGSRPTERGFDEYLGIASGNADHFSHVYAGKHDLYHNITPINRHGEYSTDLFADAAMDFMQRKSDDGDPWFVYLPFDAPHHPGDRNIEPDQPNIWKAPDYAFEAYKLSPDEEDPQKRFNAVVTSIDMAIGRIMKNLDSLGIAENTFVFFYSDNGAFYPYLDIQSNAPFKGAGVTLWEGGIRVPAIARWPGQIEANSVIDTRLWSLDVLPSCLQIAKAQLPSDRVIDGESLLPNLLGKTKHSPHSTLYFEYENFAALHWGDYKIIREDPEGSWQLYNLMTDRQESINIAKEREDLVKKLGAAFMLKKDEIANYLLIEKTFSQ